MSAASAAGDVVAVLTGDLVGSRALPVTDLDRARGALEAAARDAADWEPGLVAGAGLEVFRGDSWQLCLARPVRWLRVALFVRARLKALGRGFDTRIGAGLGPVERLDTQRISRSTGLAFERSGAALDAMGRDDRILLAGSGALSAAVAWAAGEFSRRWTPDQAAAVALMLPPVTITQHAAGLRLGKSQQAVARSLRSAHLGAIGRLVRAMESEAAGAQLESVVSTDYNQKRL